MNDHASAKTLFFVCGTGKCGSTWLQLLLDAHPDVICRGEAHLVSDLIKPMLEIVDKYNATITTKGGKNLATYGNFSGFAKFFANSWNDRISTTRQVATGLGNHRYIEVRYEDLLDKPQESLSKLFDFLGVGHSSAILNHCLEATRFDKLSEGRQQGNEDPESFYRKGIAGDWRNVFKPEDNDYFYSHAGELMESLGYSKD